MYQIDMDWLGSELMVFGEGVSKDNKLEFGKILVEKVLESINVRGDNAQDVFLDNLYILETATLASNATYLGSKIYRSIKNKMFTCGYDVRTMLKVEYVLNTARFKMDLDKTVDHYFDKTYPEDIKSELTQMVTDSPSQEDYDALDNCANQ